MTRRAIFLGLLTSLLLGVLTPYSDLVLKGTWMGLTSFPLSALALLVLVVAVLNAPLKLRGKGLSPAELAVIYCCALLAAGLPSFGWTGLLIPYLAGPFYFARPENKYSEILLPNIPSWFHPHSDYAITKLYEGLKPGERIPWGEWVVPLATASGLGLGLFACYFALSALLRRRWVQEEKLVFPLMELPAQLIESPAGRALWPNLLRNRVMWAFFAIPFLVHTINGVHYYYPVVPQFQLHTSLDPYIASRPWNAMSPLLLQVHFSIMALAYILPSEISFSLWAFYAFFLIQQVLGGTMGMPMPMVQAYPVRRFVGEQMIGGIIAFGVLDVLAARGVWQTMWARMFGGGGAEADRAEAMRPGPAGWLLVGGMAILCLWGSLAGAGVANTLILMALYMLVNLVGVRLVCEAGMLLIQHPYRPLNMLLAAGGTRAFAPRQLTMLAFLDHFIMLDNRSPTMPGIMQSLKFADRGGADRGKLLACVAAAVAVAVLSSYVSYLYLMYRYGGSTLHPWFTTYYAKNLFSDWTTHLIRDGEEARPQAFVLMAVGAASMVALLNLHHRFTWWPLSPVGYLLGASFPMLVFWFPIFVGWLIKTTVLHYGGPKAYRAVLPGFLGWLLAEFLSGALWVFIDMFAGVRGHQIFTF